MTVDERGYAILDLAPLLKPGVEFAVRCYTRDEAKHLLSTMLHQYPCACRSWGWPNICWEDGDARSYTDYYPDINHVGEQWMSWDAAGWAEVHSSVVVIPFHDLIMDSRSLDFGALPDARTDIAELFGMI